MNRIRCIFLAILSFLFSINCFALNNPVQGFYGGLMAEISHGPTHSYLAIATPTNNYFFGTITNSMAGGGGGGMLGYKFQHLRIEGELLYNRFSTGPVRFRDFCTVENVGVKTTTGPCPQLETSPDLTDRNFGFKGSNAATFGFVNAYYDFFRLDSEADYPFIAYIGAGFGKVQIKNLNSFVTLTPVLVTFPTGNQELFAPQVYANASANPTAGQGIIGIGYFMDDFTWFGMDYRYIKTQSFMLTNETQADSRTALLSNEYLIFPGNSFKNSYSFHTLNFSVNFAFDVGGIYC